MEPGITWYDVLGVLPGAEAAKIRREYDAKTSLLRPELISGAPSNVVQAISRAQSMLDNAWQVLGDPVNRRRYDESIGLRGPGGHLREPGSNPDGSGLGPGMGHRRAIWAESTRRRSPCPTCAACSTTSAWRWRRGGTFTSRPSG